MNTTVGNEMVETRFQTNYTHQVYDLLTKQSVFVGTEQQCLAWLDGQRDYHSYDIWPLMGENND